MTDATRKIIDEDRARLQRMHAPFNPVTGEGSVGDRIRIEIPDFPIPVQWIPRTMENNRLVRLLRAFGVNGFLQGERLEPTPANRDRVIDAYTRLRCRHDFPFWAATFVYIQNKEGGDDVLFRLTYPQRKFVEYLERQRLAGKPIRIILLKARQWGGSTTSQLYMAWMQLTHKKGLNSLIATHVLKASANIKEMFRRMLAAYPVRMLHDPGEGWDPKEPKLEWVGGSDNTQRCPQRNFTISIGSAEAPDSIRSGNYSFVHLSEVGLWKATDKKGPADIVRAACSGVLYRPGTMIVYESTANGVGNFFHNEYTAASNPDVPSQFSAVFVPWYDIEIYSLPFDTEAERERFAAGLWKHRDSAAAPSEREQPGRYMWWLWQKGATLEGLHWYVHERAKYSDHGMMASEYPSDDIEAFVNSGANVFDQYAVEALRKTCRAPLRTGELEADAPDGAGALKNIRFREDTQGGLAVWAMPDPPAPEDRETVTDRYLTVVDVGGRGDKADWSVICVIDRLGMVDGDKPAVVAQWRGHTDIDLLAWKAARIAAWYDDSLLVIESNTIETHERDRHVDGDQSQAILAQIKDVYPNLYARRQSEDAIREGRPVRYGFHTNTLTKPMIITTLVKAIREGLYVERDHRCIDEYRVYERKQNGSYGALQGKHDDLLMTRAIGLHVCFNEMEPPQVATRGGQSANHPARIISEATI